MAKIRVFVTLDENNVRWLRARGAGGRRGLSETVDALVTTVRRNGQPTGAVRSVVDTIMSPPADPDLARADAALRTWVNASLARTSTMGTSRAERSPRRPRPGALEPHRFRLSPRRDVQKPRRG